MAENGLKLEMNGEPLPNETVSVPEARALDLVAAPTGPAPTLTSAAHSAAVALKRQDVLLCALVLFRILLCTLFPSPLGAHLLLIYWLYFIFVV